MRCLVDKAPKDFAWRDKARGKRFGHCRACQAEYHRKHYKSNRAKYIEKASVRTRRIVEERWDYLIEFLSAHPCVDCGESDVLVLEFDHLHDKEFNISSGIRNRSWPIVLAELKKCEVTCGNCHRRRTAHRASQWRTRALDPEGPR